MDDPHESVFGELREGFIVIRSTMPLDVIGVDTAASLVQPNPSVPRWASGEVSSIHLDGFQ